MRLQSAIFVMLVTAGDSYTFQSRQTKLVVGHQRPWGGGSGATCLLMSSTADPPPAPQVKRLQNSAVEIEIPVPGSATKAAYDKICTELSKQITLPGFRKGSRIPPQVLESTMAAKGGRNAIKVQAINELVNQLVAPTLKEHSLDPIGQPTLQVTAETLAETFVPGKELTLNVQCDVWPEIQWKNVGTEKPYVGLQGSYKRKPFNQEKLNLALRDLKERYATLEVIDDDNYVLQMGDACTVNMVGYMATEDGKKGEPLPAAASGDNVEVILGPGRYMTGLVEGLVGHKKGETVTITVSFPEKLRDKSLAGKRAIFDVDVLECSKRTVPDVTDEFASKVKAGLTAEALLAELRKAVDAEDAKEFVPARNAALGKALAERMDVDVPDTLITNQAREKFAVMMAEMRDNGVADEVIKQQINPENFLKYKEIEKPDIIRDFKVSMATDEIARLEGIKVPDYQIEEQMEAIRKDAAGSEDFDENMVRVKVETTLQRQAVFELLANEAKLDVIYEDDNFDEALLEKLAQESLEREKELAAKVSQEVSQPADKKVVESEPVAEKKAPAEKKEEKVTPPPKKDYSTMTLQEKAFAALLDAGAVQLHKSPDDPDYDSSDDDQLAPENVYVGKN